MPAEGTPAPGDHEPKPRLVYEITDSRKWEGGNNPGMAGKDGIIQHGWKNPGFPDERVTLEEPPTMDYTPQSEREPESNADFHLRLEEWARQAAQELAAGLAQREGIRHASPEDAEIIRRILVNRTIEERNNRASGHTGPSSHFDSVVKTAEYDMSIGRNGSHNVREYNMLQRLGWLEESS